MKKQNIFWRLLILGVSVFLFPSCKATTEVVTVYQSCDCPAPLQSTATGYRRPRTGYANQYVSVDGHYLSHTINGAGSNGLFLLDLKTLEDKIYPFRTMMPDTADWLEDNRLVYSIWCPYDGNKIYLQCSGSYKQGGKYRGYIYNILTKDCIRIKPSNSPIKEEFKSYGWMRGSTEFFDTLQTGTTVYVPQEDKYYPSYYPSGLVQSPYTDDEFIYSGGGTGNYDLTINSTHLYLSTQIVDIFHVSWSPNKKELALTVRPNSPPENPDYIGSFPEVWIMDIVGMQTDPSQSTVYRLNFQNLFCKYSFWGIDAEYITDSTLAVSMHKDGDAVSPLWEITDRGKVVRQLTK